MPGLLVRLRPLGRDGGSAIVEFCYLALLLMIPLAYAVLTVFRLQAASYAVTAATREAGRAFVLAHGGDPQAAAFAGARLAAGDHGLELTPAQLTLDCRPDPACPLTPGQRVEVRVAVQVPLPLVPPVLGGVVPASVAVTGHHVETVDRFRGAGRS